MAGQYRDVTTVEFNFRRDHNRALLGLLINISVSAAQL